MIVQWYVGFVGDYPGRLPGWFDIFTTKKFRHVCAIGYDPQNHVWVLYDPTVSVSVIQIFHPDDPQLNKLITCISHFGRWLKVKPAAHACYFGRWRHYCVPAIKHLLGVRSSALTPRALYRDLVMQGAQPAFEG